MHKALKAERGKMEPHLWCSRDGESGFVEVLTEGKMVICFSKNEQKPNQMGEEKHIPGRAPPPPTKHGCFQGLATVGLMAGLRGSSCRR